MTKKEEFKVLSPRDHCRKRPGMYVGNTSYVNKERFVLGEWRDVRYVPALLKLIDEIIDNSLDEAIRSEFKHATIIDVSIDGNTVTVSDNGRGIPQDMVKTPDGKSIIRPAAAWTVTNAGTSFGENRTTIGSHGLGSALVTFFSKSFHGKTWKDGVQVNVRAKNGLDPEINDNPKIEQGPYNKEGSGTIVKFTPDFDLLECDSIEQEIVDLVQDRLTSMAICFPKITFKFNKRKVGTSNFRTHVKMFSEDSVIHTNGYETQLAIVPSDDGFRNNAFVNGVHTSSGGAYVDYVANTIADRLIPMIKRKHKITVSKLMVKNSLALILFVNQMPDPKFDSQTKERLTNTEGQVKAHFAQYSSEEELEKIAKKILTTEALIDPIIQAELAKRIAAEKRKAKAAQKKLNNAKVAKHIRAGKPDGMLFICEGDSASGFGVNVRDEARHGFLPLRGVIPSVWSMTPTKVLENKELKAIIASVGLDISDPDSVDSTYYRDICILVDADHDGMGHISPLLIAFFYKFWPRLFEEGRIHIVESPILITKDKNNGVIWSYTYDEANRVKKENPKAYFRYIKGLASLEESEYDLLINQPRLRTVSIDDPEMFEVMFGDDTQLRKDLIVG